MKIFFQNFFPKFCSGNFFKFCSKIIFDQFYPAELTPDGVLSSAYLYVRPYVRTSQKFLISNDIFFWDHHISSSWRFLKFLKKVIFWADHALFLTIFFNILGVIQGALQVRRFMLAWFCLQILDLYSGSPGCFFHFFKKSFR